MNCNENFDKLNKHTCIVRKTLGGSCNFIAAIS